MTDHRPGLFQIGRVTEDGDVRRASGWGLNLCLSQCLCHRMIPMGSLQLYEGPDGSLGLVKMNPSCDCCQPWTFEELAAIVTELAEIQAAPEVAQ